MDFNEENCDIIDFSKTGEEIEKYSEDTRIINFCKKEYKYLPTKDIKKLIIFLLQNKIFTREELTTSKKFYQYNIGKFDSNKKYVIRDEEWKKFVVTY
jgi:hypothetical protein